MFQNIWQGRFILHIPALIAGFGDARLRLSLHGFIDKGNEGQRMVHLLVVTL